MKRQLVASLGLIEIGALTALWCSARVAPLLTHERQAADDETDNTARRSRFNDQDCSRPVASAASM